MAQGAKKQLGGKRIVIPGAYTEIQYVPSPPGVPPTRKLSLVGSSGGGKPGIPLRIASPQEARAVLQSGILLEAAIMALCDSSPLGNPGEVECWRLGAPTQSSTTLKNLKEDIVTLKSTGYGVLANNLSIAIAGGGDSLTINSGAHTETIGNLNKDLFQISSSAGASATIRITLRELIYTKDGGTPRTFAFEQYPTLGELVNALDAEPTLSASLLGPSDYDTGKLDSLLAETDIKAAPLTVTGNLFALLDALKDSRYIEEYELNASRSGNLLPDDQSAAFTGGSAGPPITGKDWSEVYAAMEAYDTDIVVPLTTNAALIQLASAAASSACDIKKGRNRMVFAGGPQNESITAAIANAKAINSEHTVLCYAPGHMLANNVLSAGAPPKKYDSRFLALKLGAMIVAQPPNFVPTNKAIASLGWGKELRPAEREELIIGGLVCGVTDDRGMRIVERGITTSQGGDELKEQIVSQLAIGTIVKDLRHTDRLLVVGLPSTDNRRSTMDGNFYQRYGLYKDNMRIVGGFKDLMTNENGAFVEREVTMSIVTGTDYVFTLIRVQNML